MSDDVLAHHLATLSIQNDHTPRSFHRSPESDEDSWGRGGGTGTYHHHRQRSHSTHVPEPHHQYSQSSYSRSSMPVGNYEHGQPQPHSSARPHTTARGLPVAQYPAPPTPPYTPAPPPSFISKAKEGQEIRDFYHLGGHGPVSLNMLPDPKRSSERPTPLIHQLAVIAIHQSPDGMLMFHEIKDAIQRRYAFYANDTKWENSLRHALSYHSVFRRVERASNAPGRGSYWSIDVALLGETKRQRKRGNVTSPVGSMSPPESDSENDSDSGHYGSSRPLARQNSSGRRGLTAYPFDNVVGSAIVPNPASNPPPASMPYNHPPTGLTKDYTNVHIAPLRPPFPGYDQPRMSDPSPGIYASTYRFPEDREPSRHRIRTTSSSMRPPTARMPQSGTHPLRSMEEPPYPNHSQSGGQYPSYYAGIPSLSPGPPRQPTPLSDHPHDMMGGDYRGGYSRPDAGDRRGKGPMALKVEA
ncbi:hypothetical protein D9758_013829 [Tetrapyrgos nigripes]|uniref:Fork-head domain-containing protein n=1 Tax=Tetrapyrgos nigripes TaxID=182062 RepID=A0A8H5FT59_9AGAR|nr:hypothetical protein D9758_013829 [Tetrapyrgos nigripes]